MFSEYAWNSEACGPSENTFGVQLMGKMSKWMCFCGKRKKKDNKMLPFAITSKFSKTGRFCVDHSKLNWASTRFILLNLASVFILRPYLNTISLIFQHIRPKFQFGSCIVHNKYDIFRRIDAAITRRTRFSIRCTTNNNDISCLNCRISLSIAFFAHLSHCIRYFIWQSPLHRNGTGLK